MTYTNRDWLESTGSEGYGGSLGFTRPMRDPRTRQLVKPFARGAAGPPKPKPASAMTKRAREREIRRCKARIMELEAAGK